VSLTLAELIARITPENVHKPIFEELVGSERWSFAPGRCLGRAEP
jgi:hypothetical protein